MFCQRAKSSLWNQIKADITGVDILIPENTETALLGAAIIAGVSVGVYKDYNEAVKKMYEIKKRPENKKFVIQVADISQIIAYRPHIELEIKIILGKFWPGPLTVILNTKYGKTGFRMPDNKTTLAVIREADFPLMVTSANISGEKSLLSAKDAISVFNGLIEVVVNDKTKAKGIASTVLDCSEKPFKILRKGPLGQALKRHQKDILWSA